MPTYRRWVFEVDAPRDGFTRALRRALLAKGVRVGDARFFDFVAEAWGTRAFVKLAHDEQGVEVVVKLKTGPFGSASALEEAILKAGREAQAQFVV